MPDEARPSSCGHCATHCVTGRPCRTEPCRTGAGYNRRCTITRHRRSTGRTMPTKIAPQKVLDAVRAAPGNRVKVAVSDIDGVLRGKYLHKDKVFSAAETAPDGGLGFCDVVFGWDMNDQCYDNSILTGWHTGFPDAVARIDLGTYRRVPWDGA